MACGDAPATFLKDFGHQEGLGWCIKLMADSARCMPGCSSFLLPTQYPPA